MALKIKISKNGKLFVSHVQTNGASQKWFKNNIGDRTGACVFGLLNGRYGTSSAVIHDVAKYCAPRKGQVVYTGPKRVVPTPSPLDKAPGGAGQGF